MWPTGSNYQKVSLRGVCVPIRLGVLAHEKTAPQTVEVDVELYRRHDAYRAEGLDDCLNYDAVYRYVTVEWPERGHADLLETWAEDLVGHCMGDDRVDACRVRLRKPDIYPGTAVPEIEVVRHREAAERTAP